MWRRAKSFMVSMFLFAMTSIFIAFRYPVDNADHPLSLLGGSVIPGGGLLYVSDGVLVQLAKES
jgi:hypothetical protein